MYAHISEGVVVGIVDQPPARPILVDRTYDFHERERVGRGLSPSAAPNRRVADPAVAYGDWYARWVPLSDEDASRVQPGWRYDGSTFQPPEVPAWSNPEVAAWAREKRNALLAESDRLVMPDRPLSLEQRGSIERYRQSLRDLPTTIGTDVTVPEHVAFPELP